MRLSNDSRPKVFQVFTGVPFSMRPPDWAALYSRDVCNSRCSRMYGQVVAPPRNNNCHGSKEGGGGAGRKERQR